MSRIGNQGFIRTAWNYFMKTRPAQKKVKEDIVGTDFVGNTYILRHGDQKTGVKDSRLVIPSEEVAAMYTERLGMDVPQEWEAWLRHRRDDPPTLEELEMNKLKRLKMQQRVKELERKERLEKGEDIKEIDSDTKTDALSTNITQDISGDTRKSPFPVYDDLERVPGEIPRQSKP